MQGSAQTLNPVMMRALKQFQVASASFPDFCRDWARKLSVREHDNLGSIKWAMHDGVETGSYVGYSSIDSCTCKEATNGVAVGILTYKEFDYTLTGKSVDEAEHYHPARCRRGSDARDLRLRQGQVVLVGRHPPSKCERPAPSSRPFRFPTCLDLATRSPSSLCGWFD